MYLPNYIFSTMLLSSDVLVMGRQYRPIFSGSVWMISERSLHMKATSWIVTPFRSIT